MKTTLLILSLFSVSTAQAQLEMGFHYFVSAPLGNMGENIQPVHHFEMLGYSRIKETADMFFIGGEGSFGQYAWLTEKQTFISSDGSSMTTDVNYSSNVFNLHAIAGYDLLKGTAVVPYVIVRGGMSVFATSIVIEDPEDEHSCHPLESRTAFCDKALSGGMGAGIRLDASSVFCKSSKGKWWFDFSANYLHGSTIDYVNVKYLSKGNRGPNPATKEVDVPFINMDTQQTHEHRVAEVYTSKINMLDFKLGIIFKVF